MCHGITRRRPTLLQACLHMLPPVHKHSGFVRKSCAKCRIYLLFAERCQLYVPQGPQDMSQGHPALNVAIQPCFIRVWKLLMTLVWLHKEQKHTTKTALFARKAQTRLLKAGHSSTEDDSLLSEAEARKEDAQAKQRRLQRRIDNATVELGTQACRINALKLCCEKVDCQISLKHYSCTSVQVDCKLCIWVPHLRDGATYSHRICCTYQWAYQ